MGVEVTITRYGGFTGIPAIKTVNSDALSAEDANTLRSLIDAAQFDQLPSQIPARASNVDRFEYQLRVVVDGKPYSVRLKESALPPALRTIIDFVWTHGRQVPAG